MVTVGMRGFVCRPAYDTIGKRDTSGAFAPEAARFISATGIHASQRIFDNNRALPDRRKEVSISLERCAGLDLGVVAFFCHGWRSGLQAGHTVQTSDRLAALLAKACTPGVTILLYACDTARDADADRADDTLAGPGGAGGFASVLAQACWSSGLGQARVFAHSTAGHTTQNPWLRVWENDLDPEKGSWVVEPHSQHWGTWRRLLAQTSFRYTFWAESDLQSRLASYPANP